LMRSQRAATLVSLVSQPVELDHPVAVLRSVNPPRPEKTGPTTTVHRGTATVDFYVDESGRPRMPVVVETTNPGYAEAAVGALNEWRFAAPTRRGQPVVVRVRQQFVFQESS
jgi:TonB family protein